MFNITELQQLYHIWGHLYLSMFSLMNVTVIIGERGSKFQDKNRWVSVTTFQGKTHYDIFVHKGKC